MLVPQANSTVTSETPGREIEFTRTTLLTTPTNPSAGSDIRRSISKGATPGYSVRTVIVGYVISGSKLTASREKPTPPNTTIATISMATVTRRRVEKSTSFI